MDAAVAGVIVAAAVPVLTAGVWLLRLEGRINTHEAACDQRQKKLDERHEHITQGITRIDSKLDSLMDRL